MSYNYQKTRKTEKRLNCSVRTTSFVDDFEMDTSGWKGVPLCDSHLDKKKDEKKEFRQDFEEFLTNQR